VFHVCFLMLSFASSSFMVLMWAFSQITAPSSKALKKHFWEITNVFFSVIFLLLIFGSYYYCNDLSLSFLFRFCAKKNL
jgi:hypothetical protein